MKRKREKVVLMLCLVSIMVAALIINAGPKQRKIIGPFDADMTVIREVLIEAGSRGQVPDSIESTVPRLIDKLPNNPLTNTTIEEVTLLDDSPGNITYISAFYTTNGILKEGSRPTGYWLIVHGEAPLVLKWPSKDPMENNRYLMNQIEGWAYYFDYSPISRFSGESNELESLYSALLRVGQLAPTY